MTTIPDETLESIAADIEAAAATIGAKYGLHVRFRSTAASEAGEGEPDGLVFDVVPMDDDEVTEDVRNSDLWKTWVGTEADG